MRKVITIIRDFWPIGVRLYKCDNVRMKWIKSLININDLTATGTWFLVASISLYAIGSNAEATKLLIISGLFASYFITMIIATRPEHFSISLRWRGFLLLLQLLSAFSLMLLINISFLPILTIIWVAILAHFINSKLAAAVTVLVVTCWFVLYQWRWQEQHVLFAALLYATFHFFALLSAIQSIKSQQQAEALLEANQQLVATQHMLREMSAFNERNRIARDLHDLLGHHLTALTINLQVAERLSEGEAKTKISQSHQLAKLLLSDVRETVHDMREDDAFDFEALLDAMLTQVPRLTIHRKLEARVGIEQIEQLKVILSTIQEAITNTLKHSGGEQFWLELTHSNDQLKLQLWDDGKASSALKEGNGLRGMRERAKALDGEIEFAVVDQSLHITLTLPTNNKS